MPRRLRGVVRSDAPRRSFIVHQAAEYLIGVALVASGLQSPSPAVPAVLGGVVIANAAVVNGPLGAFRAVGRRTHRILDVIVLALLAVGVVWPGVDAATRVLVAGLGVVLAFVVAKTDYGEPKRTTTGASATGGVASRGERIGRSAGRLTARGVSGVKSVKRSIDERAGDGGTTSAD